MPTIAPNTLTLVCSSLDVSSLFTTDDATGRRSGLWAGIGANLPAVGKFAGGLERAECDEVCCGCAITREREGSRAIAVVLNLASWKPAEPPCVCLDGRRGQRQRIIVSQY